LHTAVAMDPYGVWMTFTKVLRFLHYIGSLMFSCRWWLGVAVTKDREACLNSPARALWKKNIKNSNKINNSWCWCSDGNHNKKISHCLTKNYELNLVFIFFLLYDEVLWTEFIIVWNWPKPFSRSAHEKIDDVNEFPVFSSFGKCADK